MQIDYKHTVTVDRNAWFIRFYCWLWEASTSRVNVCKLFWGYVFLPLGIVLHLTLIPIIHILDKASERNYEKRLSRNRLYSKAYVPKPKKAGPTVMQKVLEKIANFFSRVSMRVGSVVYWLTKHKRFNRALGQTLLGIGSLIGIAGLVTIIYLAVVYFGTTQWILIGVAGVIIGIASIAYLNTAGFWGALWDKIIHPGGQKLGKGTLGFIGVLVAGFVAVKSNTCPKIVVTDEVVTEASHG